jgi:hypothetical protein
LGKHIRIRIKGKDLKEMVSKLRRHTVVYIHERHKDSMFQRVEGSYIESILIEEPKLEELAEG